MDDDRVAGTLVGMAVGDAFAAPVEFWPRAKVKATFPNGLKEMRASHLWQAGEYTDDTQMALLFADSLLEKGNFDAIDIARRFELWARTAKDVGIQIRRVTAMKDYEAMPEKCALADFKTHPSNAAGNGAVMRCAPIAIFHATNLAMLVEDSRRSALVTHGDPKAQTSCILINSAIAHFLNGGDHNAPWQHGMKYLSEEEKAAWSRLDGIAALREDEINSNGYTVHSVEAAFWCFARTDSFDGAIELAASLGDDADTTAAIAGALAGACYGYSAIPSRWREQLVDLERIRRTAIRLVAVNQKS